MALSKVQIRSNRDIQHVKTELDMENVKFIVGNGNVPRDVEQKPLGLAQLWDIYMAKHIARFERKGIDWLKDQLDLARPLFQTGLKDLEGAEHSIQKESSITDKVEKQGLVENQNKKINKLARNARVLARDLAKVKAEPHAEEENS